MQRREIRRGAVLVESAIVYPAFLILLFSILAGGIGIFRYQQVAMLAREGSRRASVQGADWSQKTGQPCPTTAELRTSTIVPRATSMDLNDLTVQVELVLGGTGSVVPWDSSDRGLTSRNANNEPVANRVRVTVTYLWRPPAFLGGAVTLRGVSEVPMTY